MAEQRRVAVGKVGEETVVSWVACQGGEGVGDVPAGAVRLVFRARATASMTRMRADLSLDALETALWRRKIFIDIVGLAGVLVVLRRPVPAPARAIAARAASRLACGGTASRLK
ncbi:hypothetical protein BX285_5265 [Streptomyces sp. 1114.5]|nr:hypothetical protein BX285_5265 [Streptomyces sp. 1114.5]